MSLKYALLGLLAEKPQYGYEIKQRFEGAVGNVWSVSYGQLYPTLRKLSELKWVTKETAPGKKAAEKNIYSITPEGRRQLQEWLLRPVRAGYSVKDGFTLRFLFFSGLPNDRVLEYLKLHQKKLILQRETFQKTLVSLRDGMDCYLRFIMRKGILHLEAENQWLEEVINQIESKDSVRA